eukprot:TRINITY_DN2287_c0_g1_i1.p1 TRINITY_DN2287_c0_g1~~TRINITY_DN2287_c0_g1_i1.p1  ORF type:complete len:173 (-),score=7.96 TRINITY_DN2287_c0_g1_i1:95-613(-)
MKFVTCSAIGCVIGCLCCTAFLIIAIVLTPLYVREKNDADFDHGYCKVTDISTTEETCTCGVRCTKPCFGGFWTLVVYKDDDWPIKPDTNGTVASLEASYSSSTTEAQIKSMKIDHNIGEVSSCYYNPDDNTEVRWNQASTELFELAMITMWFLFAACFCLMAAGGIVLICR